MYALVCADYYTAAASAAVQLDFISHGRALVRAHIITESGEPLGPAAVCVPERERARSSLLYFFVCGTRARTRIHEHNAESESSQQPASQGARERHHVLLDISGK